MRVKIQQAILFIALVSAATAGFGGDHLLARQSGACPTLDACYRENCSEACKTMACGPARNCPIPAEIGSNCYVCARVE